MPPALVLLLAGAVLAADLEHPRLVRVPLESPPRVSVLLEAGLDVVSLEGGAAMILEWPHDAGTLARLGLAGELLDPDPGRTAALRARADLARRSAPPSRRVRSATGRDGAFRVKDLPPFGYGTMGGYWTVEEIKMKLDDLVASDANDVVADRIDTIGTSRQGRPIWGLEIGKRLEGPDTRPAVLFNALTHAREPGGMQTLFYFIDDLLGRYGSDWS